MLEFCSVLFVLWLVYWAGVICIALLRAVFCHPLSAALAILLGLVLLGAIVGP